MLCASRIASRNRARRARFRHREPQATAAGERVRAEHEFLGIRLGRFLDRRERGGGRTVEGLCLCETRQYVRDADPCAGCDQSGEGLADQRHTCVGLPELRPCPPDHAAGEVTAPRKAMLFRERQHPTAGGLCALWISLEPSQVPLEE
jgi:hypothetical protein